MKYSYENLKVASKEGARIGNWKGKSVFACNRDGLNRKGNGAYYIVYDDKSSLVGKVNDVWYKYGEVNESGGVEEYNTPKRYEAQPQVYFYDTQTYEPVGAYMTAAATTSTPGKDEVIGDVKLSLDVDATLKAAREMTVNSLLEGFNYGL